MKTGVFLCTCSGTIDMDFRKLMDSIDADLVKVHDLLCHDVDKLRDDIERYQLGRALIACTARKEVFNIPDTDLVFVNLREHCAWVHERKDATEKAGIMINAELQCISSSKITGRIEKIRLLKDSCAAVKSGITGCMLCQRACRHGAISRMSDGLAFDETVCNGCGACAAVCPLSLLMPEEDIYSKMELLLTGCRINPRILMFTGERCVPLLDKAGKKRMKYPPVLPLFVRCLSGISEAHILRAFDLGADGVILPECSEHGNQEALELANIILKEFGLDDRFRVMEKSGDAEDFVRSINIFGKNLTSSPLRMHDPAVIKKTSKRHMTLELMSGFAAKTGIVPKTSIENTVHPFADISISPDCTVCGACTSMCPTGALRKEKGSIGFIYGYCIACGLCEKACPEKAIETRRAIHLSKLADTAPETLFEAELQLCAACERPYMTARAFDRIAGSIIENVRGDLVPGEQVELIRNQVELLKYCEKCRPSLAIAKMEMPG